MWLCPFTLPPAHMRHLMDPHLLQHLALSDLTATTCDQSRANRKASVFTNWYNLD